MVIGIQEGTSFSIGLDGKEPLSLKDCKKHHDCTGYNVRRFDFADDICFCGKVNLKEPVKEKHFIIHYVIVKVRVLPT